MTSEEGSVELVDVTKRFADVVAVDALSLQVQPAEFLSLLGPSGCGKTTTLRMLAGFEEPTAGQIFISGQAVQGTPPHKRNVNTVFQHFALFPHMSVAENVAYGLRQKKEDKSQIGQKVGEALEMVKMSPLANRKPKPALRAASSSASRSRGPWSTARASSCWTSRSARSTASSVRRCRSS